MSHGKWTAEKPTEEGMYYVNLGDVVTLNNLSVEKFTFRLNVIDEPYLVDESNYPLAGYNINCKYARIYPERMNEE